MRGPRLPRGEKWPGFRGVVEASSGLLLGGVKTHRSIFFADPRDAVRWCVVVADGNKKAGRHVGDLFVEERHRDGRITRVNE